APSTRASPTSPRSSCASGPPASSAGAWRTGRAPGRPSSGSTPARSPEAGRRGVRRLHPGAGRRGRGGAAGPPRRGGGGGGCVGPAGLRVRHGGSGPAVLLLHGHPRTHVTWHRVAPLLAGSHTVVCPDLR